MKRLALCFLAASAAACSGDDGPILPDQPTEAQVRDYYGLNADSCILYATGASQATYTVEGPNMTRIAGKSVFITGLRAAAGGLPQENLFEVDGEGRLLLVRSITGARATERVTRNFPDGTTPVFLDLELDLQSNLRLQGTRFETEVTPEVCMGDDCAPGTLESHVWSVGSESEVALPGDLGTRTGLALDYRVERDGVRAASTYTLVPGIGFTTFTDATGTTFQACDLRVCDSAGNCEGAASCDALACP